MAEPGWKNVILKARLLLSKMDNVVTKKDEKLKIMEQYIRRSKPKTAPRAPRPQGGGATPRPAPRAPRPQGDGATPRPAPRAPRPQGGGESKNGGGASSNKMPQSWTDSGFTEEDWILYTAEDQKKAIFAYNYRIKKETEASRDVVTSQKLTAAKKLWNSIDTDKKGYVSKNSVLRAVRSIREVAVYFTDNEDQEPIIYLGEGRGVTNWRRKVNTKFDLIDNMPEDKKMFYDEFILYWFLQG